MKIAQIAPIWYSIPPKKYGGTELVVSLLTEGLVKAGHDVTLFASADSQTKAHLTSFFPEGVVKDIFPRDRTFFLQPMLQAIKSLRQASGFDIVHCHFTTLSDYIFMSLTEHLPNVVFTAHMAFPDQATEPDRFAIFELFPKIPFVSISNDQRKIKMNFLATVYHGINISDFDYSYETASQADQADYMFWLGRISPQKGLTSAIDVSLNLKKKLIFAAAINAGEGKEYFEKYIQPRLNSEYLTHLPEFNFAQKNQYYKNAKLFLFPIQWEEPFGLVMIEAMASGTPVVAFARGSVPEVIKDGETGFLVNPADNDIRGNWIVKKTGVEGLCEAAQRIYSLPQNDYAKLRKACRAHVEKNFSVESMVKGYEEVYQKIIDMRK